MNLHESEELFKDAIQATAEHFNLQNIFIEKDYWLTLALYRISQTSLADVTVFKGGTSLSKAYGCIERFSEDVDLAVITNREQSSNQTKKLLKLITSTASQNLKEESAGSTKGSMIRKIYYSYPETSDRTLSGGPISNKILLEVNAFAHPSPCQRMAISTYIHTFLKSQKKEDLITQFGLQPFTFKVLCLERTFTEKVMAVAKASSSEHPLDSLRVKIRHLYDIHQLMQLETIQTFIQSADKFHGLLEAVRKSDQEAPIGDAQWVGIDISSCPIFAEPENLWKSLSSTYRQRLGEIVYGKLPDAADIIESLRRLGYYMRK
ncbi:MAG: nucleotidyl transferase AbiEii/AbiGii toxin family protein [Desulfoplanes sp.]|nr:nucleotidyl transferase AbiEii/AbiGii toxin family protein [Desulfoplanes sp.]